MHVERQGFGGDDRGISPVVALVFMAVVVVLVAAVASVVAFGLV